MEPVEIDFIYGGNTQTEGKKIEQSMDSIANASKKAQADVTKAAAVQAGIIKQIEADIKSLEGQLSKAAPGNAKMQLTEELGYAKRALEEEKAALNDVNASIEATGQKHTRLRTQVMEAKQALSELEMAGKRGTPEYAAQAKVLGELNDQFKDTATQAAILADDQKGFRAVASGVSGLAGAMSAATGVAALFGAENEDLAKIQTRLQAVMAISIGVQQVAEMLNKDSYFSVVLLTRAKEIYAATNLKVAASLGISAAAARAFMIAITGGLIIAVVAAVAVFDHFISKQNESAKAAKEFGDKVSQSAAEPVAKIEALSQKWSSLGENLKDKKKFVDDNKEAFEDLGVQVNSVADAENLLVANKDAFIESLIAKARAAAGMELAAESYKKAIAKMVEAEKMPDKIEIRSTLGSGAIGGYSKNNTKVSGYKPNQDKIKVKEEIELLNTEGDLLIKQSNEQLDKAAAALAKANIIKFEKEKKEKEKRTKEVYDSESAITDLILDIRAKRVKLELDQQTDSLQKRLEGIRFERDEEIRSITDKEASIVDAYNKNHKDDKGFVAKTSLAQIDPALAKQLADEKLKITTEYGKKEVTETEKYQKEITEMVMGFADERTQIAYNYNKDIEKANELGLTDFAARMEKEKQDRINAVTIGLIEETELYKTATDDKLQLSRETTELLIADLKKRIDAEIAAGRLSKAEGDKMLAELNKAQKEISANKNQNNPFAQLGAAISGNTSAQQAFKNAPVGTSKEELAKLEDAANKARTSMAAAAGASLQGVNAILGSVVGGLDQLGLLTDEQKKDADNVMGMVGGAANIAMGIATGNPIAIIQGAVDLLVNAIEFFDFKNKKLEKSQKEHMKNVDDLEAKYKKLQRAVEKALGTDVYKAQRDQIENRKKQIQEYEAWLALEQQKKKRKQDADKIAETQGLIDDLKAQNEDDVKAITESLAQTDVKSLASELSDALVTAFQNGENAAEAMGDVVNNVLRNAVINALKLKILDKLLAPAIDQFAKDVEDNGGLDGEEGALFKKTVTEAGELYFKALNEANEVLGGIFNGDETTQTGIKGDVAKMTEETGSALTGQITAMRLNVVALLNSSKNSLDAVGKVLATLETIKDNTDRLNRIDETLYYIKQNGIKVI